jgi:hypothetical protein
MTLRELPCAEPIQTLARPNQTPPGAEFADLP